MKRLVALQFWVIILLSLFVSDLRAQDGSLAIDSLTSKLAATSDIRVKITLMHDIAEAYLMSSPDSAIIIGNRALLLANRYAIPELIVESVIVLTKAYKLSALYDLGVTLIYNTLENPAIQSDKQLKAKLLFEQGELNRSSSQYNEAISLIREALALFREKNNREGVANCQYSLAATYYEKENYFIAVSYADSSKVVANELDLKILLANNYEILGAVYTALKEYEKAIGYFNMALQISENEGDISGMTHILINLTRHYYYRANFRQAIEMGTRAYALSQQSKNKSFKETSSHYLSRSYAAIGNYEKAYNYSELTEELRSEMFKENRYNQISALNRIYESEKQKQEIANQKFDLEMKERELNRKQTQNILLFAWIGMMMVLLILVNRVYRKLRKTNQLLAKKNQLIEEQKSKIENQAENYKNAYTKLKELDQFKEAMTHMLVHDLKNPLNVLINIPELGDFEEKDDIILHTGKQMMTLVMNMLDIQKFENDRMELNRVYTPISKVMESARKDVEFSAKHKHITISTAFAKDYIVYIDKELVGRVIVNLLSNAIKFSPSNSEITINITEESSEFVRVEVSDEGVGIELENQEMIFEKFVHLKQNSTGTMRSTGLGLTFCKMAVNSHQGEIGVVSEKDNGATFWFTLPMGINK